MSYPPVVTLVDKIGMTDAERRRAVTLAEAWIDDRLAPALELSATVRALAPTDAPLLGAWPISLWTHETVAGALGHHDEDARACTPFGIVGVLDSGPGWLKTMLHELGEMLRDPQIDSCKLLGKWLYADECCDFVEDDVDPKDPNYSNIVLPAVYVPGSEGPWDAVGTLDRPISADGEDVPLTSGGYASRLDVTRLGSGWQQVNGRVVTARNNAAAWSRRGRRSTAHALRRAIVI